VCSLCIIFGVFNWHVQIRVDAEDKERKKREKEEKEAEKVLLRDQRRRIRNKCEEFDMNRSQTEDLSLALPLEQVSTRHLLWSIERLILAFIFGMMGGSYHFCSCEHSLMHWSGINTKASSCTISTAKNFLRSKTRKLMLSRRRVMRPRPLQHQNKKRNLKVPGLRPKWRYLFRLSTRYCSVINLTRCLIHCAV
jgi:hypothetical protein